MPKCLRTINEWVEQWSQCENSDKKIAGENISYQTIPHKKEVFLSRWDLSKEFNFSFGKIGLLLSILYDFNIWI